MAETHSSLCEDEKCQVCDFLMTDPNNVKLLEDIIAAAEQSQRSSMGYSHDYCFKRQAVAIDVISSFLEGHSKLCAQLKVHPRSGDKAYEIKRTVKR